MQWTAERIRELRQRLECTQEALARRLNISVDTVRRWEQERGQPSALAAEALDRLKAATRH